MEIYPYSEELANALTHGIGVVIFLVLCPVLIAYAVQTGYNRKVIGASLFSIGLLAVFASSSIYHAIPDKFTKEVMRVFDYLSIYLLLAGSYTAFIIIYFQNKFGNLLLAFIWFSSFLGISFKIMAPDASFVYSLMIYLGLGWIGIFLIKPSLRKVKSRILSLLLLGGIFYTMGTYFIYYDDVKYYHAIWHLFVLLGALTHWWAVLLSVQDKVRVNKLKL